MVAKEYETAMSYIKRYPYLSIIISSRNDNYGGNLQRRLEVTIGSLIAQLERYKLESEIILVDYNPPSDMPFLKDAIQLPNKTQYCTIRTLIVPAYIHKRSKGSDRLPFNGAFGQNAGLRRARGEFVLLVNSDILFSNEVIEFLTRKCLEGDKIYKIDKYDVTKDVLDVESLEERLTFCRENVVGIFTRYGYITVIKEKKYPTTEELGFSNRSKKLQFIHPYANDFLLMSREWWHYLHGFPEIDALSFGCDAILYYMAYLSGVKEEILQEPCRMYHINVDSNWRATNPSILNKVIFYCLPYSFVIKLKWHLRRFIIGLVLVIFIKKSVLEYMQLIPMYWFNLIKKVFGKRTKLDSIGFKSIGWFDVLTILSDMKDGKRSIIFNDDNWGLGNDKLEEHFIVKADWEN